MEAFDDHVFDSFNNSTKKIRHLPHHKEILNSKKNILLHIEEPNQNYLNNNIPFEHLNLGI